jgi:hypothetical protein
MSRPLITIEANNNDVIALIGAIGAGIVFTSCVTCNMNLYCLPFVVLLLGVVGLLTANDSADPHRTRLLSWFSIVIGGTLVLLMMITFCFLVTSVVVTGVNGGN